MKSQPSEPERGDRRRVLALAGTLATGALAYGAGRPAAAQDDASGGTIEVAGTALYHRRLGAGPPVVVIHGASGNLRDWTLGAARAMAERHTVHLFDRPGHGLSGWPGEDGVQLDTQAALLRGALEQLGVERATLVGHSYGGAVALAWALAAPQSVSALVLLACPSQVWEGSGLGLSTRLLANPLVGPLVAQAAPHVASDDVARRAVAQVFAPQEPPQGYFAHLQPELILRPETLRRNARQLSTLKSQVRTMVPRYPNLEMPIELLHGTADDTVLLEIHSEPFAAQVPHARLTRLQGIGHMPHHVALPQVLAALERVRA